MSGWPLASELPPMGALTSAPGTARAHVRATLAAWQLGHLADDAEVVASELVTNAVTASTGRNGGPVYLNNGRMAVIWLRLLSDGKRIVVEVWDQAPGKPEPRHADGDAVGGRGLHLVSHLTGKRWGWHPAQGQPGKVVWAELAADTLVDEAEYIV